MLRDILSDADLFGGEFGGGGGGGVPGGVPGGGDGDDPGPGAGGGTVAVLNRPRMVPLRIEAPDGLWAPAEDDFTVFAVRGLRVTTDEAGDVDGEEFRVNVAVDQFARGVTAQAAARGLAMHPDKLPLPDAEFVRVTDGWGREVFRQPVMRAA